MLPHVCHLPTSVHSNTLPVAGDTAWVNMVCSCPRWLAASLRSCDICPETELPDLVVILFKIFPITLVCIYLFDVNNALYWFHWCTQCLLVVPHSQNFLNPILFLLNPFSPTNPLSIFPVCLLSGFWWLLTLMRVAYMIVGWELLMQKGTTALKTRPSGSCSFPVEPLPPRWVGP